MRQDRLMQIMASAGAQIMADMSPGRSAMLVAGAGGDVDRARMVAFALQPEAVRLALVKAAGSVPEACGDAIPEAPARGAVRTFETQALYPKGDGSYEAKPGGWLGRRSLQRADVFDVMRANALRKGGTVPLTPQQVGMARVYRALVEDHEAGGVRCSSIEAIGGGTGGTQEGFTDHRLAQAERIALLRSRIGQGAAMEIRRVRPSKRGQPPRRAIPDRVLVDRVCLEDQSITAVLDDHGWVNDGQTIKAAIRALGAALDRMVGPVKRGDIRFARTDGLGQQVASFWSRAKEA